MNDRRTIFIVSILPNRWRLKIWKRRMNGSSNPTQIFPVRRRNNFDAMIRLLHLQFNRLCLPSPPLLPMCNLFIIFAFSILFLLFVFFFILFMDTSSPKYCWEHRTVLHLLQIHTLSYCFHLLSQEAKFLPFFFN